MDGVAHDKQEIRTAKTLFPSDFQTVRDADTRGPVSSDAEETTSLRALSHEGPVPSRSADNDETYQNTEGKIDQYRAPSYSDRPNPRQSAYLDDPESLPVPVRERDTSVWGIDVVDDRVDAYKYKGDGKGMAQGFGETLRKQSGGYHSPAANLSTCAGVETGRATQLGMARGLCESRPQDPAATKRVSMKNTDPACGEHQDSFEELLHPTDANAMELSHARDLDETIPRANFQHELMGSSGASCAERRLHVSDERTSQQPMARGRAHESSDTGRAGSGGIERQRRALNSRGPTPDHSPQRFPAGRGRAVHSLASSPSRRQTSSLNHLPRVPARGVYRS